MKFMLMIEECHNEQRRIVAYLDSFSLMRDLRQARLASRKGKELRRKRTLLPSAEGAAIERGV